MISLGCLELVDCELCGEDHLLREDKYTLVLERSTANTVLLSLEYICPVTSREKRSPISKRIKQG